MVVEDRSECEEILKPPRLRRTPIHKGVEQDSKRQRLIAGEILLKHYEISRGLLVVYVFPPCQRGTEGVLRENRIYLF